MRPIDLLGEFAVVEFRRYRISAAHREHFGRCFDSYFPEAIQQLGALVFGQFCERDNEEGFTWIRGFHDLQGRATVNAALYDGPVWKEHRNTMNEHMLDHTNVLLLHPVRDGRGIPVLPAVDPVREARSARGVLVGQLFSIKAGAVDTFVEFAEPVFSSYRSSGVREAGLLSSLEVENNYARLPFRTDGPHVLWLGILESDAAVTQQFQHASTVWTGSGLLRSGPELIVMDPTPRSRLRWLAAD